MVCSSPHSHSVCPSSLNPHFCIRDLHLAVPVRRRFRLDQVGHASLEPGGSDSLGLSDTVDTISRRSHAFTDCYVRLVAAIALSFIFDDDLDSCR